MNLRELIDYQLYIKREKPIGREIVIADQTVLILGLQEVRNDDYFYERLENSSDPEEEEYHTVLYILYEDEPDDEDWEDEIEEPVTRRQLRMEEIEAPYEPLVSGVEEFLVEGKHFPICGMSNGQEECISYHSGHMISTAAKAKMLPVHWLDIDERRLWCCEYRLAAEAFDAEWDDTDNTIEVIMEKPDIEVFVGKKFLMHPGQNQEPVTITITIKAPNNQLTDVTVHGLQVETTRGLFDDENKNMHDLFIRYEAPANLHMNFYRTDYLDAEQPDDEGCIFAMISDEQSPNIRYDYLGLVPDGFNETIEIELFSYYILEEDSETDRNNRDRSTDDNE